jgi:ABC-type oligopeptide transport system substrate-binding subunit
MAARPKPNLHLTRSFLPRVSVVLLILASAACRQNGEYFGAVEPPAENILRYNNGAQPEHLDPGLMTADTDWRIGEALFEGLTVKDPRTLQPQPGVAERWEGSEGGLTYTFHLRRDSIWTDGRPVTAHDFVYAWTRVLKPETASQFASQLYPILNAEAFNQGKIDDPAQLGIRALDDYTLQARLHQPIPYFVYLTTTPTFYPVPHWIVEEYGDKWTDPQNIVSNGPFMLVEHRTHDRIIMDRNPRYYDAHKVRLDRVVAYSIADNFTAINLYESGYVDFLVSNSVPPDFIPYMKGRYRDFHSTAQLASYFYSFNTTRPPLDNKLVRRALAMAVDRRAITDALLRGGQIPGSNFVPRGLPDYESPPGVEYNPGEAARLLAEAGYPNGEGFPQLEISFNTLDTHRKIAEAIQQMWTTNLNVRFRLHNEEWASYLKTRRNKEYDIARMGWIADYPDASAFIDLMEGNNANNDTGWANAEYDRLLRASRGETDPARRRELLRQAEAILLDEAPVLPIYTYAVNSLRKPYVRGIYPTALDIHPLNEVCIDRRWREQGESEDGTCD